MARRTGKEVDPWEPVHIQPVPTDKITIETGDCELVVWSKKLPGTQLHVATCHTGACVAILKPHGEAETICEMLNGYDHPNILKPIGIWKDPNTDGRSYLAFEEVHGCVKQWGYEIFSLEDQSIYGFSGNGFKIFRGIFSAVNHVNERYKKDTESTITDTSQPLHALKLDNSTIFYRVTADNEVQAVLGDIHIKNPASLRNLRTGKGKHRDATREDLQLYNWNSIGDYLKGLCKDYDANDEINHLIDYLNGKTVKYDDLHWQPGLWEADVKMQYIREVWWHVDGQRDGLKNDKLEDTIKGKVLGTKPALGIIACIKKLKEPTEIIVEKTLMDSVKHLRDCIVAHQELSYTNYQGAKEDVGCNKATIERLVQKTKGDYMIKLVEEIRKLGWIKESPLLKDKSNYMECFYEMKREEMAAEKEEEMRKKAEQEKKDKWQKKK